MGGVTSLPIRILGVGICESACDCWVRQAACQPTSQKSEMRGTHCDGRASCCRLSINPIVTESETVVGCPYIPL